MTSRKAILIGNSGGYRNLKHLKGVRIDLENYRNYLKSKAGGQWHENEITILHDADSSTILNEIKNISADYTFTTCSGHGFINTYSSSDHVCLSDIDLQIGKLAYKSVKQTIIIDACREVITHTPEDLTKAFVLESKTQAEGKDTRELFDMEIEKMPKGILVVFSTQANEAAGDDDSKGGHFTYSFLKSGRDWWNNLNNRGTFRIDSAITEAEKIMKATFLTNQNPALGGQSRRLTFPPLAFSKL